MAGGPVWYVGGINPILKTAVALAGAVDGYRVFYEGVADEAAHGDYFEWFTWANGAIESGRFEAQAEPRRTPEPRTTMEARRSTTVTTGCRPWDRCRAASPSTPSSATT